MGRNRDSAKKAGSSFERQIADYLAQHIDNRIDRRVKTGSKDKGDIAGVRHLGQRLVIECKNYAGKILPAKWVNEAHVEAGNDDALAGIVIAKRKGTTDPGAQYVLMTVNDFIALNTGTRPDTDL